LPDLEVNVLNFVTPFTINSTQLPKRALKEHTHNILLSIMEAEDDYVEGPILLQKIANYVA